MNTPLCNCHNEPMHRNGLGRKGEQKWRCSVYNSRIPASSREIAYEETGRVLARLTRIRRERNVALQVLGELEKQERELLA